jgi:hypothetical protein
LSAATVEPWAANFPGLDSRRFTVGRETEEADARWRCSQRRRALAARISSLVRGGSVINHMLQVSFNTPGIDLRSLAS